MSGLSLLTALIGGLEVILGRERKHFCEKKKESVLESDLSHMLLYGH